MRLLESGTRKFRVFFSKENRLICKNVNRDYLYKKFDYIHQKKIKKIPLILKGPSPYSKIFVLNNTAVTRYQKAESCTKKSSISKGKKKNKIANRKIRVVDNTHRIILQAIKFFCHRAFTRTYNVKLQSHWFTGRLSEVP